MLEDEEGEDDQPANNPRIRINYNLNASMFRQSFRVDMQVAAQLELHIGKYLVESNLNNALSPREQILTALHFLGNDAYYHVNGYAHNISKSTVLRCVHRVCFIIATHLLPIYVRWPTTSILVEQRFFRIAGFPNVKGVVDGTLVHIDAPSISEAAYVGRDNKHSINVILVSGPQNEFFFVSAKSPGSFHDSRATRISKLWESWEITGWRPDNDNRSLILGDSAYPLTSWLMPPVVRTVNANIPRLARAVPLFERVHRKTRFIVECSIGILKEEYPCLNYFRFRKPERISNAISACVVLHNMQNKYHRGSYAYDQIFNRIANGGLNNIGINMVQNNPMPVINDPLAGTMRQREVLEFFAHN